MIGRGVHIGIINPFDKLQNSYNIKWKVFKWKRQWHLEHLNGSSTPESSYSKNVHSFLANACSDLNENVPNKHWYQNTWSSVGHLVFFGEVYEVWLHERKYVTEVVCESFRPHYICRFFSFWRCKISPSCSCLHTCWCCHCDFFILLELYAHPTFSWVLGPELFFVLTQQVLYIQSCHPWLTLKFLNLEVFSSNYSLNWVFEETLDFNLESMAVWTWDSYCHSTHLATFCTSRKLMDKCKGLVSKAKA